jgi:hypothetical protein
VTRVTVALIAGGLGACFPVNPLRTAIEPGSRFGVTSVTSVTTGQRFVGDSSRRPGLLPALGVYLSAGRVATEGEPGVRGTLLANWSGNAGADGYLELPKEWFGTLDAGSGVQVQRGTQRAWGPYVSVGREVSAGRYLWLTQSATALQWSTDSAYRWVTGTLVGLQGAQRRGRTGAVFVGVVVGQQDRSCGRAFMWSCTSATRGYLGIVLGAEMVQGRGGGVWPPRPVPR